MDIDPFDVVAAQNIALGLRVGPHTMTPIWDGTRLDVGYAIAVLHPAALTTRADGP